MNTYYLVPVFEYEGLQKQPTLNFDQATSSKDYLLTDKRKVTQSGGFINVLLPILATLATTFSSK